MISPKTPTPATCPARDRNMATRGGGCATQRHSLSTCHPNGAPVAVKEDTAAVTKLLLVCLVAKSGKVIVGLRDVFVRDVFVYSYKHRHGHLQDQKHSEAGSAHYTRIVSLS